MPGRCHASAKQCLSCPKSRGPKMLAPDFGVIASYFDRSSLAGGVDSDVKTVGLSTVCELVQSPSMVVACCEEDVSAPDDTVFQPRLKNSEILPDLGALLCHLCHTPISSCLR